MKNKKLSLFLVLCFCFLIFSGCDININTPDTIKNSIEIVNAEGTYNKNILTGIYTLNIKGNIKNKKSKSFSVTINLSILDDKDNVIDKTKIVKDLDGKESRLFEINLECGTIQPHQYQIYLS